MFDQLQVENPKSLQILGSADRMRPCDEGKVDRLPTAGEILRSLREAKRLSQDTLGAIAGVNGQTISNFETGKVAVPRGDTFRGIAKGLEISVADLDGELAKASAKKALHEEHATALRAFAALPLEQQEKVVAGLGENELVTLMLRVGEQLRKLKPVTMKYTPEQQRELVKILEWIEKRKQSPKPKPTEDGKGRNTG